MWIDLCRVSAECVVTLVEEICHIDLRGHPFHQIRPLIGLVDAVLVRARQSAVNEIVVESKEPALHESVGVVHFRHNPRLAFFWVEVRVPGAQPCADRHRMGLDVVGMRVSTVLVIRDHDVRAEFANDLNDFCRGFLCIS